MSTRVAIVGLGRLGTCLARALRRSGVTVTTLASPRTDRVIQDTQALGFGASPATPLERVTEAADWVFVTVPDAALASVTARLQLGAGQAVMHCSGALDASPLKAALDRGAAVGIFHPLQAFGPDAPPERFAGIAVGIDAEAALAEPLARLAERLGALPFSLRGVDRVRYHAAAVFASNYLVALHGVAARVWAAAGLPADAARAALATLSRGALDNIDAHELAAALTGPIARGDAATVARHLGALQNDLPSLELYRALARELLRLPLNHAGEVRAELERALSGAPAPEDPGQGVV